MAKESGLRTLKIEALASGFVALLALAISAYTVYVQRQQLKAQVWPHASIQPMLGQGDTPNGITLTLKNRGVGPARIESFQVTVAGTPAKDWIDVLNIIEKKEGKKIPVDVDKRVTPMGEVLGPAEDLVLFSTNDKRVFHLLDGLRRTTFSLCYCSVLDDCWVFTIPGDKTVEVKRCPVDPIFFRPATDESVVELYGPAGFGDVGEERDAGTDGG